MDGVRIIVADDHPLFREGVVRTLAAVEDFEVVAEASDRKTVVELAKELLPDVILMDVSMPGGGINAAAEIASACPIVRIVMLTVAEDEDTVHEALGLGASGYVLKGVSGDELVNIVRNVFSGQSYITPSLAATLLQSGSDKTAKKKGILDELTPRERDILAALAEGDSNKEIAAKLFMAERTVKHHMTNILSKLQLKNRVEAALFAQRNIEGEKERR